MRTHTPLGEVAHTLIHAYRSRTILGLGLMTAQAFFYNAIFFTYALILTDFYAIPADHIGWYLLPFAAGNFLGPLLLGRLFDTLGRRMMITFDLLHLRRAAGDLPATCSRSACSPRRRRPSPGWSSSSLRRLRPAPPT